MLGGFLFFVRTINFGLGNIIKKLIQFFWIIFQFRKVDKVSTFLNIKIHPIIMKIIFTKTRIIGF
jgi:hypothetical protein